MTLRYSTGARNFLANLGGLADMLQNGQIELRTGAQPASADAAPTGTLLCTITDNAQARTAEVRATGTMTLTGGAAGSVDAVTVNSVDVLGASVPFNATLTQTAADVAAQINRHKSSPNYEATSSGAVITIKALPGTGTQPNTYVVAGTLTTITASYAAMASGVAAANGLKFDAPSSGEMDIYTGPGVVRRQRRGRHGRLVPLHRQRGRQRRAGHHGDAASRGRLREHHRRRLEPAQHHPGGQRHHAHHGGHCHGPGAVKGADPWLRR
jgi:hypothetical protein